MCLQFWKFHKSSSHSFLNDANSVRILQVALMITVIIVLHYVFSNSSGILCISLNNWKLEDTFMQSTNALWKYLIWSKQFYMLLLCTLLDLAMTEYLTEHSKILDKIIILLGSS